MTRGNVIRPEGRKETQRTSEIKNIRGKKRPVLAGSG